MDMQMWWQQHAAQQPRAGHTLMTCPKQSSAKNAPCRATSLSKISLRSCCVLSSYHITLLSRVDLEQPLHSTILLYCSHLQYLNLPLRFFTSQPTQWQRETLTRPRSPSWACLVSTAPIQPIPGSIIFPPQYSTVRLLSAAVPSRLLRWEAKVAARGHLPPSPTPTPTSTFFEPIKLT